MKEIKKLKKCDMGEQEGKQGWGAQEKRGAKALQSAKGDSRKCDSQLGGRSGRNGENVAILHYVLHYALHRVGTWRTG